MKRHDTALTIALGASVFAIYALGACPTIYVGDSGELVTAVYLLGIPHPTGYPLYALLGKLWTLAVPVGSIAFRMSLFSAASAAAAVAALHDLCLRLRLHPVAALLAALLLAFAPSFWGEATVQRVYALNALFVVLATAAAVRWHRVRTPGSLALAFFVCGLGATNHTFLAFYALAFGAFAASIEPRMLTRPRVLAGAGLAFAAGLLPYAYLPIRSAADPLLDWGNPETVRGVLEVITRRGFWERAWVEGLTDVLVVIGDWSLSLAAEAAWVGLALAVAGTFVAWRRERLALLPVLVMAANVLALVLHGSRSDIFLWHRYYVPSYAMAALLAGFGADWLVRRAGRTGGALLLLVPMALLVTGWRQFDRSRYRLADDFSRRLLASLPPGAHLFATDDNVLFVLIYLQFVEGVRPDVDLILQGVGAASLPNLRFDPDRDPVFFTHHPNWNVRGLEIVPAGLTFRAWRAGTPPPPFDLPPPLLAGETDPRVPKDYLTENLVGHFHYMRGLVFERDHWLQARAEFEKAEAAAPRNDVLFFNLGLVYRRNGLFEDALAAFARAAAINPRELPSGTHPRAIDKAREVEVDGRAVADLERTYAADAVVSGLVPGSAAHHRAIAELLDRRGADVAARGHRLRALELDAGVRVSSVEAPEGLPRPTSRP